LPLLSQLLLMTEDKLHDRAIGVSIACLFLGQFLNPWVMAPLRDRFGQAGAITILGVAFTVGGVGFLLALLRRRVMTNALRSASPCGRASTQRQSAIPRYWQHPD